MYKLASCAEYRTVATVFGVSKTTVQRYVHKFVRALCRKKLNYIKWYSDEEAVQMADYIEQKYKYPQAIGAIDGSHIPVNPPADGKADYLCRKGYPSIVLQAVVDGYYKFRDVYANTPGAAHDSTVLNRSPLAEMLNRNMPSNNRIINNNTVPLHLLGDPAYPMSDKIVKGYIGTNITPEEDNYNVYHSSARMCVEIAFGKLKSRWRILQKRMDVETQNSPMIVLACCILHNICEDIRVPTPPRTNDDAINEQQFPQPATFAATRAENENGLYIRNAIKDFLVNTQPLRKSFRTANY